MWLYLHVTAGHIQPKIIESARDKAGRIGDRKDGGAINGSRLAHHAKRPQLLSICARCNRSE